MIVRFKVITWQQVEVPEHLKEKAMELIRSREADEENKLEIKLGVDLRSDMDEYAEPLSLSDNGDYSTVEVLEGDKIVYRNGEANYWDK
ncbi:hypothetical protein [Mongoliitalea daihaiensis]|uniref:hypothetical protein n=1 Tax=Mongoliitalea daihaiensis TaxID=2782006 RepID=UPI001F37F196|nr:hypothetical protein [Mongoliitalea daihaiensis]UJP64024.1 hypothetical protein IPZ59_14515 [Mongoliitalea daihaiensis]